jgi:zinc protease
MGSMPRTVGTSKKAKGGRRHTLDLGSLPGPETIRRTVLPNGIVVLARENFSSPSVVVAGYLSVGAVDENLPQAGLAGLTAGALMRGTSRWSFNEIYESLESVGASLGISAGRHFTSFQGKGLAEDLELTLSILAEALRRPTFPQAQVERLRGERLTSLRVRDDHTGAVAGMAFDALAYPNHPYAVPSDGTVDSVGALTASDLAEFHRRFCGPKGMVVAVVGGVKAGRALDLVERAFGDWSRTGQPDRPGLPAVDGPEAIVRQDKYLPGKSQCDIVLGSPGPARSEPGYLAAALGNSILGRFGLMGRIGDAVRETAGLAYYAYSTIGASVGPEPWEVVAGVSPANIDRAIDLIRQEIRKFTIGRVTVEELQDNQAQFTGRLPLQLETNEGVAGGLVHLERFSLGLDYYQRYPDLIQAVTRDEILEMARRYLDADRLAIAVAGSVEAGA